MDESSGIVNDLISRVTHPSRYLGGEINSISKDLSKVSLTICLAFPDVYEIGMSHLGLQILYHLLNKRPDIAAERVYSPGLDMEQLIREEKSTLTSLESSFPLCRFDLLGFSLQYELSYTNIVNMLDLSGIPLYASQRSETYPLIIGGGPCAFNPEPLSEFFDAFVIGDGEEVMLEIADCVIQAKRGGVSKTNLLHSLARIEGVYIPSFFDVLYADNGTVNRIIPLKQGYERIKKRWIRSLDDAPFMSAPLVPYKQIVHDRLNLEIARGCTRGCRFCQAGIIYRPVRERGLENLKELAERALKSTGYSDLSLASLSTGDYSCIGELLGNLMDKCAPERIAVSLPSLRSETLTPDLMEGIKKVRKTGFTIAPEAGTQRLRDIINKGITEDEILTTVDNVFDAGWNAIKLYFMVGLPDETEEDLHGIVNLSRKVLMLARRGKKRRKVNVSVSTFVPKAHTPFQWVPQVGLDVMRAKQEFLKEEIRRLRLTFKWQDVSMSYLEGIFARGDRRLSRVIEKAWRLGCRFDGWSDHLEWNHWQKALSGIDQHFYTTRKRPQEEIFPWEYIDTGVEKSFLWKEYQRGLKGHFTPDCRTTHCQQCGVCNKSQPPVTKGSPSEGEHDAVDDKGTTPAVHGDRARLGNHPRAYHRIRVKFAKRGKARFLSHLELLTVFSRALKRAGIPLRFSEGFHPLPRIVLGPALPVGFESSAEYLDLQVHGIPDCGELSRVLNCELPEWLAVLESHEIPLKFPSISDSIVSVQYRVYLSDLESDPSKIALCLEQGMGTFSAKADNYIKIKHKSGSSLIDLKEWVEDLCLKDDTTVEMRVKMTGGKTVRPFEILQAVFGLSAEDEKGRIAVLKTDATFRVGPFPSDSKL
jgi:radical SAM family uncharacterized protein/radical SAM-linked protein